MTEEHKRLLEKQLWNVADILRGKMNADEYKNYILGFIFYKYLSERIEKLIGEYMYTQKFPRKQEIADMLPYNPPYLKREGIISRIKKAIESIIGIFECNFLMFIRSSHHYSNGNC